MAVNIGQKLFLVVLFFLSACTSQVHLASPVTLKPQVITSSADFYTQNQHKQLKQFAIKKTPSPQAKMSIQSQPGRPGFYQTRVQLDLPKPQSLKSFKTQALPLNLIQFVKVEITGVGIATPLWADGADGAGLVANVGGNVTLTVSNVPYGKARVATLTAYGVAKVAIPGAVIKSTFDTQNPVENLEMSFRSTPNGDAVSQMFGSTANDHTATTMDLSALETLVDAITGQGGTYPTYTYSQAHPSLVNTAQLATDLLGNGGNPGALTAATYRISPAQVDVTLAGLISSDTATVQVTDPASNILAGASNGVVSVPGVSVGTWITEAPAPAGYTVSGTLPAVTTAGNTTTPGTITFTWANTPNISSLSTTTFPIGASIQINGTDFHPTTAGNDVKFNGVTATVTAANATQLTVMVPAGATDGNVTVQVGTKLSNTSAYTIDDPPNISSVTPSKNPLLGLSHPVEIVAVATDDITTLVDGSYSWTCTANCGDGSFNRTDSDTIIWTAPSTPQGGASVIQVSVDDGVNTPVNSTANITVNNGNGDVNFNSFMGKVPKITGTSVADAQVGATISINGSNFHAAANGNIVKFGSVAVLTSDITVVSDSQLDIKVPQQAAGGPVTITVSTGAQVSNAQAFTVLPGLDSISPNNGSNTAPTAIEIWGNGFQTGASVDIGVTAATGVVVQSPNRITATVPSGISLGLHDVTVTNVDTNSNTINNGYEVVAGFSPPSGTPVPPAAGKINSLMVDPNDSNTIFAATGKDELYRTTDGGVNWSKYGTGLPTKPINEILNHPTNSNIMYTVQNKNGGVQKSTDAGANWNPRNSGLPTGPGARVARSIVMDPNDSTVLYISLLNGGVFKSTDAASNWNPVNNGLLDDEDSLMIRNSLAIHPTNSNILYAVQKDLDGNTGGIFKTTDGGANWSLEITGMTVGQAQSLKNVAIDPNDGNILFAGTVNQGIWRSTDGASSWTQVNAGLGNLKIRKIAVDPNDSNKVYVGTANGLYRSTNGGLSWNSYNTNLSNLNIETITIDDSSNPSRLLIGTNNGEIFIGQ